MLPAGQGGQVELKSKIKHLPAGQDGGGEVELKSKIKQLPAGQGG